MTFEEYQQEARKTAIYPGRGTDMGLAYTTLGLASESGEFAGLVKKLIRDKTFVPGSACKELGDILWYIAMAADEMGYSLEEVAQTNVDKLRARQQNNTIRGSGDER